VQFDSDDDLAAEEEAEALRLQREQAAKLQRANFGLEEAASDDDDDDDEEEGEAGTLQAAATVRSRLQAARTSRLPDAIVSG
jgi:hypothetical protein